MTRDVSYHDDREEHLAAVRRRLEQGESVQTKRLTPKEEHDRALADFSTAHAEMMDAVREHGHGSPEYEDARAAMVATRAEVTAAADRRYRR